MRQGNGVIGPERKIDTACTTTANCMLAVLFFLVTAMGPSGKRQKRLLHPSPQSVATGSPPTGASSMVKQRRLSCSPDTGFLCKGCAQSHVFHSRPGLYRHIRDHHPDSWDANNKQSLVEEVHQHCEDQSQLDCSPPARTKSRVQTGRTPSSEALSIGPGTGQQPTQAPSASSSAPAWTLLQQPSSQLQPGLSLPSQQRAGSDMGTLTLRSTRSQLSQIIQLLTAHNCLPSSSLSLQFDPPLLLPPPPPPPHFGAQQQQDPFPASNLVHFQLVPEPQAVVQAADSAQCAVGEEPPSDENDDIVAWVLGLQPPTQSTAVHTTDQSFEHWLSNSV